MALLDLPTIEQTFALPFPEILRLPYPGPEDLTLGIPGLNARMQQRPIDRRPLITLPGLEDVVHVVPESWLPEDEQRARKRRRAEALARSPVPDFVRGLTNIVTYIDDVNDALVTASVLTRVAALGFPQLRPVAIGLGAAADATNTLNFLAGLPLNPLASKVAWKQLARGAFGSQAVRAKRATNIRSALPGVGEVLQILQTTDEFFGVGLSLGPVVGLANQIIFGLPQNAEFVFPGERSFRDGDEILANPDLLQPANQGLFDTFMGKVFGAAEAVTQFLGLSQPLPWSDHFEALIVANLAAELGRGYRLGDRALHFLAPYTTRPLQTRRPTNTLTRRVLLEMGLDPDVPTRPAIPGLDLTTPIRHLGPQLRTLGAANMQKVLADAPDPRLRPFASSLATDLTFRWVRAFEGPDAGFEAHDAPATRVVTDTLELGLLPPAGATPPQTRQYVERGAALYPFPDSPIPVSELRELHARTFKNPTIPSGPPADLRS